MVIIRTPPSPCRPCPSSVAEDDPRRRAILEAATELFLARGFEGTTIDALIARIGGSRRAIYERFGSKEALLEEIVTSHCQEMHAQLDKLTIEDRPPRETLIALGEFFAATMLTPESIRYMRLLVQETARNPELGQLMMRTHILPTEARLQFYFEKQNAAGRLRIADPARAASMFFGMVKSTFHMRALFCGESPPQGPALRALVEGAVDIFLHGVCTGEPASTS